MTKIDINRQKIDINRQKIDTKRKKIDTNRVYDLSQSIIDFIV